MLICRLIYLIFSILKFNVIYLCNIKFDKIKSFSSARLEQIFKFFLMQNKMITTISNETPIALLTVGQLRQLLNLDKQPEKVIVSDNSKRLVYGLHGIRSLFNVSHATAQRYKDTIIKDAVSQNGRKIIVDVDKALELFNAKMKGK